MFKTVLRAIVGKAVFHKFLDTIDFDSVKPLITSIMAETASYNFTVKEINDSCLASS
jgi:hypothetical protein